MQARHQIARQVEKIPKPMYLWTLLSSLPDTELTLAHEHQDKKARARRNLSFRLVGNMRVAVGHKGCVATHYDEQLSRQCAMDCSSGLIHIQASANCSLCKLST